MSIATCFGLRQDFWLIGKASILYLSCMGFPLALPDSDTTPKRQRRNNNNNDTRTLKHLWLEWMYATSLCPNPFTSPLACPVFL